MERSNVTVKRRYKQDMDDGGMKFIREGCTTRVRTKKKALTTFTGRFIPKD